MQKLSLALGDAVFFLARSIAPVVGRRLTAFLLIAMLASPVVFFGRAERVKAANVGPVLISAPPDPFATYTPTAPLAASLAPVAGIFTGVANTISSIVAPSLPAGLEAARIPSFGERVFAFAQPLLGFISPSAAATRKSEIRNPQSQIEPPMPQPASVVDFDFDNDGKADIGRWHSANNEFKVKNSNGGSYSTFTLGGTESISARITPSDFNGDSKTDAAIFLNGTWTYKTSPTATAQTISFGSAGDIPIAGDYDGDGTTDAAIFRPSTNTWWIRRSSDGSATATSFGSSGDIAVPGEYDGDGKNDLALFRPIDGDWHITGSSVGYYTMHWGVSIDTPVPADFEGDGKTDPAVFRPSTGTWYVYRSALNNGEY